VDEVPRGVVDGVRVRARAAGAALVEQHGAVVAGVEEAALRRAAAGARPAMQQQDRLAGRLAALLPIHHLALVARQLAAVERLDLRVELAALHHGPSAVLPLLRPPYIPATPGSPILAIARVVPAAGDRDRRSRSVFPLDRGATAGKTSGSGGIRGRTPEGGPCARCRRCRGFPVWHRNSEEDHMRSLTRLGAGAAPA